MSRDRWTMDSAEAALGRKVKITGKVIEVKSGSVGINLLSALDYLANYHKYIVKYIRG